MDSVNKDGEQVNHPEELGTNPHYETHISEAGLSVLRTMIGNRFYRIYAPCLHVAGSHLAAPSLSIPVFDKVTGDWSHRYVIIRCDWSETPLTFTDYWQVFVSIGDGPLGIDVNKEDAIVAPCTIEYFQTTPISEIEIYEYRCSYGLDQERENVRYDKAIRFLREDGKAFCITCQLDGPGIATDVHISEDKQIISEFLDGSELRLCLVA